MIRTISTGLAFGGAMMATAFVALAHEGHEHAAAAAATTGEKPPQVVRWELMDEIGENTKTLGGIAKGEIAWDAAAAEAALVVIADNGRVFLTLFPEGSETGHETRALPAIWERWDVFEKDTNDMVAAAEAAIPATAEGLDAFRASFRDLGGTCRACHTDFRAEKN